MTPRECPTCGEKILPSIGECLYCPPPGGPEPEIAPPAPPPVAAKPPAPPRTAPLSVPPAEAPPPAAPPAPSSTEAPAPSPSPPPTGDAAFGLTLFEAEESLARGHAEKAVVHASRAVRERPENLTARSLYERARRELVRGKRRERIEGRLREAQALFEAGAFAAAEKIVTSTLKLIPDHRLALDLFGRLKERRLAAPTAEAEAERELDRVARVEAHRALESARKALAAGWDFRAMLVVRRGLRLAPDDPELLALHEEVHKTLEISKADRAGRHTLQAEVRTALDRLGQGDFVGSLKRLRALLRENPDYAPAQAAIQEVRRAWLARAAPAPAAPAAPRPVPAPPSTPPIAQVVPPATQPAPDVPLAGTWRAPAAARVSPEPRRPSPSASSPSIPPEILLPRTRRATTPWPAILGGAAVLFGLFLLMGRGERDRSVRQTPPPPPATAAQTVPPAPATVPAEGPFAGIDPDLASAIETTLAAYSQALEAIDAQALEKARPDLTAAERDQILEPFRGALNVATDLRVLDVTQEGDVATLPVLRTDVIVGGRAPSGPPVEETLRFERREGQWVLRPARP